MNEIKSLVNGIVDYMEQDNRAVHIGCYSIALTGLTIAIRKVRPFSKFKRPTDIPNHFITEKRELTGVVDRIDPNGALLMINHKPLMPLPGIRDGHLPVKLSGVNISGLGISWLQTIVAGQEVKFIPITKNKDYLQCEVLLPQSVINKKKKKSRVQLVNVAESLVKIGFGQIDIDKPLLSSPNFQDYYNKLQSAEQYALRKRLGFKYYIKPTKLVILALSKKINDFAVKTSREIVKLPKMYLRR